MSKPSYLDHIRTDAGALYEYARSLETTVQRLRGEIERLGGDPYAAVQIKFRDKPAQEHPQGEAIHRAMRIQD